MLMIFDCQKENQVFALVPIYFIPAAAGLLEAEAPPESRTLHPSDISNARLAIHLCSFSQEAALVCSQLSNIVVSQASVI